MLQEHSIPSDFRQKLSPAFPKDFPAAAEWFGKAAKKNDPVALYDLGAMYEKGRGVPRLLLKARELYRPAAQPGNQQARRLAELNR